jgi:hypothetical protein
MNWVNWMMLDFWPKQAGGGWSPMHCNQKKVPKMAVGLMKS